MQSFYNWQILKEAFIGYASCGISRLIEGRRDPEKLRNKKEKTKTSLFDLDDLENDQDDTVIDPARKGQTECPITPLSGYETHIKAIQSFAFASPENFAQVLMFSPLSANVPFPKHWNNYHVLMMILRTKYPDKIDRAELEHVIDSFGDYLHSMGMTIGGFKLDTIVTVWNNKQQLMDKLTSLAQQGSEEGIINELIKLPGVQPVKAGFIAQLLFGKAGCIDTHNLDIYGKAFPELQNDLNPKMWGKDEEGTKKYVQTLDKLKDRGIGTKHLWDVWVDFVENFYKMISKHGLGSYTDMGSAIDNPDDPAYAALKNIKVPKVGATTGGDVKEIQPISGKAGMGASATHLPMMPNDALVQFHNMYNLGKPGSDAARSIPFRSTKTGKPVDSAFGLDTQPSLLKYFGPALRKGQVDPEIVRRIITKRSEQGGKKARKSRGDSLDRSLWGNFE